jgi:hypothetical protein
MMTAMEWTSSEWRLGFLFSSIVALAKEGNQLLFVNLFFGGFESGLTKWEKGLCQTACERGPKAVNARGPRIL